MNSLIEKEINTCNAERNCIYDELELDKIRFATQIQRRLGEIEQNLRCQEKAKKDKECEDLKEMVAKLNKANRKLESENGVLHTRGNHALAQIKTLKEAVASAQADVEAAKAETKKMAESRNEYRQQTIRLQTKLRESASMLDAAKVEFEEYKEAHQEKISFKPAEKDYVGKYLNMRENRGLDVENYWNDLVTQFGESVLPFERQIRGAKTYNEAFAAFMKYRNRIDESAGAAAAATIDPSVSSIKERKAILEEAGMQKMSEDLEDINALELERMKKMGLM